VAAIEFLDVTKVYGGGLPAVDGLQLTVEDGEFAVLLGPSGCGKSTALRMVAGLEAITGGEIRIGGRVVNTVQPRDRDIAMVFQNYALYPHMNVRENLGFGLSVRRTPKAEMNRRIEDVASLLGLELLLDRKPAQLSGGQRQRVAMGRAIIREPVAFLMDEPLSNLDAKLRVGMRASLAELHARLSVTSIYVTHDQTEAMTLGHRVAVMRDGRIVQVDAPQRLYHSPNDLYVAAFIGSPSMNLVEATIDGNTIAFGQFRVPLSPRRRPPAGATRVVLGIRPEAFDDAAFAQGDLPRIDVTVEVLEELGSDSHVFFHVAAPRVAIETRSGSDDEATILAEHNSRFIARVNPGTRAVVGEPIELALNPASFHFFDVQTGESLLLADTGRQSAYEEALPG
jgi:multiple sugar transport system ATP-binding protein